MVHDGLHVLVAAPGQVDHHQVVFRQQGCALEGFSQGKPDKENKFRIKNDFGKFTDVQVYTNKDVP